MKEYYRITHKGLCFGVIILKGSRSTPDFVLDAAPVGKWMKGKHWKSMAYYWAARHAKIERLEV